MTSKRGDLRSLDGESRSFERLSDERLIDLIVGTLRTLLSSLSSSLRGLISSARDRGTPSLSLKPDLKLSIPRTDLEDSQCLAGRASRPGFS
jgi:hypothetical protein